MTETYLVDKISKGQRLDAFLAKNADISRAQAKKAILSSQCLVDNLSSEPDVKLPLNASVTYIKEETHNDLKAEQGDLTILYQDDDIAIINKTPNLTVHPSPTQSEGTLVHLLLTHFPQIGLMEGTRPGIVHRIDKDTSGIIVIALHDKARRALVDAFAQREVYKEYLAIVHGVPPQEGMIDKPIGRHASIKTKMDVVPQGKGKDALTTYKVLYADPQKRFALLAVQIFTGRTHQIRVHLSSKGHPLWGDSVYTAHCPATQYMQKVADRQMLHAWKIKFKHPMTDEEIDIICPMPDDMHACLQKLGENMQKIIITGSAGCGKSTVLDYFANQGQVVWSADACVQELYSEHGSGTFLLRRALGTEIVPLNQGVNKKALAKLMREDDRKRVEVETIVHPLVFYSLEEFFKQQEEAGKKTAFAEVPLYFESNYKISDKHSVICVCCDTENRYKRLQNKGWTLEQCEYIDKWQLPENTKAKQSDIVIDNNKDLAWLEQQCSELIF